MCSADPENRETNQYYNKIHFTCWSNARSSRLIGYIKKSTAQRRRSSSDSTIKSRNNNNKKKEEKESRQQFDSVATENVNKVESTDIPTEVKRTQR